MSASFIISKIKAALIEGVIILILAAAISVALSKGIVLMTHNAIVEGKRFVELKALIVDANDYLEKQEDQSIIFERYML